MDYMVSSQNKRRLDTENCHFGPTKKLCNGLGVSNQLGCAGTLDSPMNTCEMEDLCENNLSNSSRHPIPSMMYAVQSSGSGQCPRCMAGESGHINHIMGYY